MVNERNPPRDSKRVSLIPEEEEVDEDGNTPTPYHIQDQAQLEYWMKKDPQLVFSMIKEMKKDYEAAVNGHNDLVDANEDLRRANDDMIEKFQTLEERYKVLKTLSERSRNQGTPGPIESVETGLPTKTITTKKFPGKPYPNDDY